MGARWGGQFGARKAQRAGGPRGAGRAARGAGKGAAPPPPAPAKAPPTRNGHEVLGQAHAAVALLVLGLVHAVVGGVVGCQVGAQHVLQAVLGAPGGGEGCFGGWGVGWGWGAGGWGWGVGVGVGVGVSAWGSVAEGVSGSVRVGGLPDPSAHNRCRPRARSGAPGAHRLSLRLLLSSMAAPPTRKMVLGMSIDFLLPK
jgi:hypothetical protein